jgi:hypothetical protein
VDALVAQMGHAGAGLGADLSAGALAELATARRATAPFHNLDKAMAAGWDEDITGCMEHPELGGMGHHYAKLEIFDGTLDAALPQALVYEPQRNGRLRLVALEYLVPIGAWTDDDPPMLFDQEFARDDGIGFWLLHAWIWHHNPAGMFADWNPRVSCQYAE